MARDKARWNVSHGGERAATTVEHAVGLVAVAREPLSPLVAALFAAAKKMMAG